MMKVLITGADGFIAKNLKIHLSERKDIEVLSFTRDNDNAFLIEMVKQADFIFHLAGINRPKQIDGFKENQELTHALCEALLVCNKKTPIVFTSSTQALLSNPYGESKSAAEDVLQVFSKRNASPVYIYQLPNVFGKWARPNYNSAVATFCYNITHDLPIEIHNPHAEISLVYVDDVIKEFLNVMNDHHINHESLIVDPIYKITVGKLAEQLYAFRDSRHSLITEPVGKGLIRALYSTYVSYLPPQSFSYTLPKYEDIRGVFVEILKTTDSGQISYFTAPSGVTRGGHYHHTKTEKFLVIKGKAQFRFKNIVSDEYYDLYTSGDTPTIVETVPGWSHDITNVGDDEMIVMLWANEIFDRVFPDTYTRPLTT
jgi:UDP-2-acetamido-2,6-beta-L-arabino-hexul-4-ose reductase